MRTTQRKGDTAVTQAIATFTKMGFDVSLPVTESAPYDLIVDIGKILKRVQVRFMGSREVDLRRVHSNSKGYVVKKITGTPYDWLYVLNKDGTEYLFKHCFPGRRSITPSENDLFAKVLKSH